MRRRAGRLRLGERGLEPLAPCVELGPPPPQRLEPRRVRRRRLGDAGEELRAALEAREDYLKGETLALSVSYPGEEGAPDGKEGKAGELVFSIDFTISE